MPDTIPDDDDLFCVGKVVGFHGLNGCMKVRPTTNNPELLLDVTYVFCELEDGITEKVNVESLSLDKKILYLILEDYESRTDAEELLDAVLYAPRAMIRELGNDEWWIDDLIGLDVYIVGGSRVGIISGIVGEHGELLEILKDHLIEDLEKVSEKEKEKATVLVPFVKQLVPTVDMKNKRVEIVDLPGLID